VQIAGIGSELLLKNSDPILHTVHARLGKETLFNVGLPRWRQVSKVLDRLGAVRIDCDVLHTWMSATIVVVSSPYFAVTGAKGLFTIEEIPAGKYDVEIWHEVLGTKKAQISVPQSGAILLDAIYGQIPEMKP
jgi:high-affinity iron transporter